MAREAITSNFGRVASWMAPNAMDGVLMAWREVVREAESEGGVSKPGRGGRPGWCVEAQRRVEVGPFEVTTFPVGWMPGGKAAVDRLLGPLKLDLQKVFQQLPPCITAKSPLNGAALRALQRHGPRRSKSV